MLVIMIFIRNISRVTCNARGDRDYVIKYFQARDICNVSLVLVSCVYR